MALSVFIKRIFGREPADELALLASDSARREQFLRTLANCHVWVMGDGSALEDEATDDSTLQHIRRAVETDINRPDQMQLYTCTVDGRTILPFFSSQEYFQPFIKAGHFERITTFQGMFIEFAYLLHPQFSSFLLVLNPGTLHERRLTEDDRTSMIQILQK
jgi:hypothetical protein